MPSLPEHLVKTLDARRPTLTDTDKTTLHARCEEFLEICRHDQENLSRMRLYYIRKSREYGMTLQRIADILGITESGVRAILRRAAK